MEIKLIRKWSTDESTMGEVYLEGRAERVAFSLELPWRNNEPGESCIPVGRYELAQHESATFRRTLVKLVGVPNRSYILIHPANYAHELRGCIALGLDRTQYMLLHSRAAVDPMITMLLSALKRGEKCFISITEEPKHGELS